MPATLPLVMSRKAETASAARNALLRPVLLASIRNLAFAERSRRTEKVSVNGVYSIAQV